jgi:5-methylcytosine-specific restriction endonuclease McrA
MAFPSKIKEVAKRYDLSSVELLTNLYIMQKLSTIEISEKFLEETGVSITPRSIQKKIKSLGKMRSLSEAFKLAINKGRKSYDHLAKPIKSSELRRGINLRLRYEILKRDNFRCVLCGRTGKDTQLEIDHIIAIVKGGTNSPENLRVLCRACNRGKKFSEAER